MLRIRSKDDFFVGGTSPWLSQNRRRNRKRYLGTWQEHNQRQFPRENGSSILDPWIIDDIEGLVASEARQKNPRQSIEALVDEVEVFNSSLHAQHQLSRRLRSSRRNNTDDKSNERAETTFSHREGSYTMGARDDEGLGFSMTSSPMGTGEKAIGKTCYQNASPYGLGEEIETEKTNTVEPSESPEEGTGQSPSKRGDPEGPQARFNNNSLFNGPISMEYSSLRKTEGDLGNIKFHKPPTPSNSQSSSLATFFPITKHLPSSDTPTEPSLSPQESEVPGRSKYPCIFKGSRSGQDTPPATASKPKKKRKKSQMTSTWKKRAKRATAPKTKVEARDSPASENGQSDRVEGGDNGVEFSIVPDNNHNLACEHGTSPATVIEASSPISILSKTPSVMSRQPSKEPPSGRQPAESKATCQSTVAAAASPSLPASETPENSQQARYVDSPERPTTISEITNDEIEERKVFVPDRVAVRDLNRLFFTPRPARLLTREEMSRFLDPNLLPRFNLALRKPSEPEKK
ncbi:uncharacterized protein DFL_003922 [Arthrobotrys flagrans]|uniref:Uncharacterized protein n=1 Tax=Arthrobotrys flagrans TaxID=97331 RepID=A0A437A382_ARTFL|nr:hypothetical protein DFL_003922 [Arthrobotrys flagrans]